MRLRSGIRPEGGRNGGLLFGDGDANQTPGKRRITAARRSPPNAPLGEQCLLGKEPSKVNSTGTSDSSGGIHGAAGRLSRKGRQAAGLPSGGADGRGPPRGARVPP